MCHIKFLGPSSRLCLIAVFKGKVDYLIVECITVHSCETELLLNGERDQRKYSSLSIKCQL